MSEFTDRLGQVISAYVPLTDSQLARLEAHFQLLQRWNRTLNLTAIRDVQEAVERHYAESVYFGHCIGPYMAGRTGREEVTAADVGSGAGFPGVVLAVLRPEWRVSLVESHRRKAVFLAEASRGLPNVRVLSQRAEDLSGHFDILVSRAVRTGDILGLVPKFGDAVGLLVSDVQRGELSAAPFQWDVAAELPWARTRVALAGVPRGT